MADLVGEDDIAHLMEAFAKVDIDKDGLINTDELRQVLHSLGQNPTDADLQDLAYAMDTDESGKIDLPEFLHMMAKRIADTNLEEDVLEAFKVFDKDGNGFITARELKLVMSNLGESLTEEEVEAMIIEVDMDGDGCINYAEFFNMVNKTLRDDQRKCNA
eukprot:06021.XXX_42047_41514_1 [CDS] Oithona nana genome sequencing.